MGTTSEVGHVPLDVRTSLSLTDFTTLIVTPIKQATMPISYSKPLEWSTFERELLFVRVEVTPSWEVLKRAPL